MDAYGPDDLAPLLARPVPARGSSNVSYRQGRIVYWNPATAENIVNVGGTDLSNLSVLNTSEALILSAGAVVGLICIEGSWAILGRLTVPGTPEAASALSSINVQSASITSFETTSSATYTDLATIGPTLTVNVPPTGRLLVIVGCTYSFTVARGFSVNSVYAEMSFAYQDANGVVSNPNLARSFGGGFSYDLLSGTSAVSYPMESYGSRASLLTGLPAGPCFLAAKYKRSGGTPVEFSNRNITAMAI